MSTGETVVEHMQETEARQIDMYTKLKALKLALILGEDGECNLASPVMPIWTKSGLRKFLVSLYTQNSARKQKRTHCIRARWENAGALNESALEMLMRS